MKIRIQNAGRIIGWFVRAVATTLTYEVEDRAGVLGSKARPPIIWTFWHNRMFVMPYIHEQWLPHVHGCILSSPSGDGQVIADVCAEFGFKPVRGSSSRQGMSALITLADMMKQGFDVGITPDGPRGPCYSLNPGLLKLAQLTGAHILPVHVQYDRPWKFKSTWDRFQIPRPFSKVRMILTESQPIARRLSEEGFEQERLRIEKIMQAGAVDYDGGQG